LPIRGSVSGAGLVYRPAVLGYARVGFRDTRFGVQADRAILAATPLTSAILPADWEIAQEIDMPLDSLDETGREDIPYADLPQAAALSKSYTGWSREFADWVFRTRTLKLLSSPSLKQFSLPGETERDFRIRIQQATREQRDTEIERLRDKYSPKMAALQERIRKSEQAVDREAQQARQQKLQTAISFGATLLSSFLGRKAVNASSISRATTTIRGASRSLKESGDVERSKETAEAMASQLKDLEEEFRTETESLTARMDTQSQPLETHTIRPLKQNVQIKLVALAWMPYRVDANGVSEPAWE